MTNAAVPAGRPPGGAPAPDEFSTGEQRLRAPVDSATIRPNIGPVATRTVCTSISTRRSASAPGWAGRRLGRGAKERALKTAQSLRRAGDQAGAAVWERLTAEIDRADGKTYTLPK